MTIETEPRTSPRENTLADAVVTYVQPFYNLRTSRLQGLEALARRECTGPRGTEPSAGLLAQARQQGQAREVDLRVLDATLGQLAHLQTLDDEGTSSLIVRVNVSEDTIAHPYLVADVTEALRRHDIPGDRLLVDIPTGLFRTLVAGEDGTVLDRLRQMQEGEIAFCLDGFTADDLDLLPVAVSVPVDIITLHPQVLAGETAVLADLARAVQDAGLPVVAAGVETTEQLATVRDLGFEWAQGFLLGEPVPAGDAHDLPTCLPDA